MQSMLFLVVDVVALDLDLLDSSSALESLSQTWQPRKPIFDIDQSPISLSVSPSSLYRPVDAKLVERKILVEEKLATPDRRRNRVAAGAGHYVDDDEGALLRLQITNLLLRDSGKIKR